MTIAHQASPWRVLIDIIQRSAHACCLAAGGGQ